MPRTILIVDDEAPIRRAVRNALRDEDTRVIEAGSGTEALDQAAAERPQLIVLDLGLPDMPGLDVCRSIRGWSDAAILVLSARHGDDDKATLLDAGADDFLTKPFSTVELTARVRALLRRAGRSAAGETAITAGTLRIDLRAREVTLAGNRVHLTPIEWELLRVLATERGRTLTHQHLFRAVWSGRAHGDAQHYLRVHVANLRRKIEPDPIRPRFIVTEPGVGYRFDAAASGT